MKLYYSPGACSLSPHIVLREAGAKFELERVDLQTKRLPDGSDFREVNPKGYVPVLRLNTGELLTEGPIIVQYVCDTLASSNLLPAGGIQRYRALEWSAFIATELHARWGPLFSKTLPESYRSQLREKIGLHVDRLNSHFGSRKYLMGATFAACDAYLFTVLNWGQWTGDDIGRWPAVRLYYDRVRARATVQAALKAEGLTQS